MQFLKRADGTEVDEATALRWFPEERPPPPDGSFEIGIALAGAVSGGAYAAGVLDFLFEALDAWSAAKTAESSVAAADRKLPGHRVQVPTMVGASAGSINGAIAAVVTSTAFAPARHTAFGDTRPAQTLNNPFYRTWVRRIDIGPLLNNDDLVNATTAPSLLNSRVLDDIARELLDYTSITPSVTALQRPWLGPHWQLGFTLTNLDGVVYPWDFNISPRRQQHQMRLHGDVRRFAVPVAAAAAVPADTYPPDVMILPAVFPRSTSVAWQALTQTALGSAAFPAALQSREITRPADDYRWRFVARVGDDWLQATANVTNPYAFTCVDGGAIDNEPFEQVHALLAGSTGSNPREGDKANRAILLIDPFNDDVLPQVIKPGLVQRMIALFTALLFQARFDGRNVALAGNERIYSRHLVAPSRKDTPPNGYALAASGLGAFLGFFSEAYRHHDFFLGRANAQRFLRDYFTLPETNPLIANHWSVAAKANPAFRNRGRSRSGECQIIPLVNGLDADQPMPIWPKGVLDPATRQAIEDRIDARIKLLFPLLLSEAPIPGWLRAIVRTLFGGAIRGKLTTAIRTRIDDAVRRIDLG